MGRKPVPKVEGDNQNPKKKGPKQKNETTKRGRVIFSNGCGAQNYLKPSTFHHVAGSYLDQMLMGHPE